MPVEVGEVIADHFPSLAAQGEQHRVFPPMVNHPGINLFQQGLTLEDNLQGNPAVDWSTVHIQSP